MEDFKNSVAHLDVDVQTAVSVSGVVGENFWKFMYITNETIASLSTATAPLLITMDTYSDVIDGLSIADADKVALIKKNLASLFDYAPSAQGYFITADTYERFKYYAYWCYLETEYELNSGTGALEFSSATAAMMSVIDEKKDAAFSGFIADLAVDAVGSLTAAPSSIVDTFMSTLGALTVKVEFFARGATNEFAWKGGDITIGYSPAMYQLGRTLGFTNSTGTPIGNSGDTVACAFQDVLPTRSTSTSVLENASALFINWCQNNKVAYFKTIGNGTAQVASYGGWTLKTTAVIADWIVAYVNFMVKVRVAEVLTVMNTYRDSALYGKCLAIINSLVSPFISLGRVTAYQLTAPSWAEAKELGDRETIVIPDAWTGVYVDNARKVKIQGSLTI